MDRRQLVTQRVREYFGERVEDVLHVVRQDREELRGWQEPAHLRAAARRTIREGGTSRSATTDMLTTLEFGRTAGEPERGQQREATGQLLEAGLQGLEKTLQKELQEITPEEVLGLECVLLFYGRPGVLVKDNELGSVSPLWNLLEDQREEVELAQRGVGRIELLGHPELDWAGTGFLVSPDILMTTRRVADLFIENRESGWQFRPGITTWMNYRSSQEASSASYRVRGMVGVHDRYDLALLEVEPPHLNHSPPTPLALASIPPSVLEGRPVYLVGYPVRDARRNEPEPIARIFRDVYNVKRVHPGMLRGTLTFHELQFLRHDAAPLGQLSGAPLIDLETHQVLGIQMGGRYLDNSTTVPLYQLHDDPLLRQAGVLFAEATPQERQSAIYQLQRLARTPHWQEARETLASLYRQAFGETAGYRTFGRP